MQHCQLQSQQLHRQFHWDKPGETPSSSVSLDFVTMFFRAKRDMGPLRRCLLQCSVTICCHFGKITSLAVHYLSSQYLLRFPRKSLPSYVPRNINVQNGSFTTLHQPRNRAEVEPIRRGSLSYHVLKASSTIYSPGGNIRLLTHMHIILK